MSLKVSSALRDLFPLRADAISDRCVEGASACESDMAKLAACMLSSAVDVSVLSNRGLWIQLSLRSGGVGEGGGRGREKANANGSH